MWKNKRPNFSFSTLYAFYDFFFFLVHCNCGVWFDLEKYDYENFRIVRFGKGHLQGWRLLNISYAANIKAILNSLHHVRLYF